MPRPIHEIAREIRADWKKVHFTAAPYLHIMDRLETINEKYFAEDARTVITYFLENVSTWKGEVARRIKAELREMCK